MAMPEKESSKLVLLGHETILLPVLATEWFYFKPTLFPRSAFRNSGRPRPDQPRAELEFRAPIQRFAKSTHTRRSSLRRNNFFTESTGPAQQA